MGRTRSGAAAYPASVGASSPGVGELPRSGQSQDFLSPQRANHHPCLRLSNSLAGTNESEVSPAAAGRRRRGGGAGQTGSAWGDPGVTPWLPPRVSTSGPALGPAAPAGPGTLAREGGESHAQAGLADGATRKSHTPAEPPALTARPPEAAPRPAAVRPTDSQRTPRAGKGVAPLPHFTPRTASPPTPSTSGSCGGLAGHGDFSGTQTRPRRDLSAPSPTPDPIPNHGQAPSLVPSSLSSTSPPVQTFNANRSPKPKSPFNPPNL